MHDKCPTLGGFHQDFCSQRSEKYEIERNINYGPDINRIIYLHHTVVVVVVVVLGFSKVCVRFEIDSFVTRFSQLRIDKHYLFCKHVAHIAFQ